MSFESQNADLLLNYAIIEIGAAVEYTLASIHRLNALVVTSASHKVICNHLEKDLQDAEKSLVQAHKYLKYYRCLKE